MMDDVIAAKFEITELIGRYGNALDSGDFDRLEAMFTDDAAFHVVPAEGVPPMRGGRAIRDTIEKRWKLVHRNAQRRHVMSNIVVESVDGDRARARTVLLVYEVAKAPGSEIHLHGMGVYEDVLARQDGRWCFAERRFILDRTDYFGPGWVSDK